MTASIRTTRLFPPSAMKRLFEASAQMPAGVTSCAVVAGIPVAGEPPWPVPAMVTIPPPLAKTNEFERTNSSVERRSEAMSLGTISTLVMRAGYQLFASESQNIV